MSGDKLKTTAIVLIILFLVYLFWSDFRIPDWIKEGGRGRTQAESPELRAADLRGRLRKAEAYTLEVSSRLDAYRARFDCPEAQLLDRVFLDPDGYLSVHPLRREWYAMRMELPEYLEKQKVFLTLLREARSDLTPDKVTQNWTLPERATAWNDYLAEAIAARTRKFPMFDNVVRRVQFDLRFQQPRVGGRMP